MPSRMRNLRRAVVAVALVAGFTVAASYGLSAASASDRAPTKPETLQGGLSAVYKKALKAAPPASEAYSILAKAVETGQIDPAAYERMHRQYSSCMTGQGFAPEFRQTKHGIYVELPYRRVADSSALDSARSACSSSTAPVTAAFHIQQANPETLKDTRIVAVRCLVDARYVRSGYTAEEFEEDWATRDFPFDAATIGPNDCLYEAGYAYFDLVEASMP